MGDQRQHRRLDADHRRRGSRPRVPAGRDADVGLLRRPPSRQQPVRREPRLRRSEDRAAQVALPARAPPAVELRHVVGARFWRTSPSNGRAIKAVAVPGKQGILFVFDRVTGQPVWPIEERAVPQSDVPGEKTSPTQPFPTKPPAYARNYAQGARRSDRLHAGAARAGAQEHRALQGGAVDVQPGGARRRQRHPRRDQHGERGRRHQLAGRRLRSGDAHDLSPTRTTSASRRRRSSPPPPNFSDIRYVSGIAGRPFQEVLGPGDCCAADSPRAVAQAAAQRAQAAAAAAPAAPRRAAPAAGAGGRRADRRRPADPQAAVRHDLRHQSRSRRDRLAGAARRHAGQRAQSSGAEGPDDSEDRSGRHRRHRPDGDQDARRHGRSAADDDARASARRDAAGVRQDDRARKSARCGWRRRRAARR